MQYFSWSFKNFCCFARFLQHISLNMGSKKIMETLNSVYSFWNDFFLFFLGMVIFTTLFRRWPTLWNSRLKKTTLFRGSLILFISALKYTKWVRLCSTLYIPTLKYTTLFQCWFDVVVVVVTSCKPNDNVETTLKCFLSTL